MAVSCLSPVRTQILMSAFAKLAIVSGTPCILKKVSSYTYIHNILIIKSQTQRSR